MAELSEKLLAWGGVHEFLIQFSDRDRHAVLLKGVVVSHPRGGEDEQEGVLKLACLPALSSLEFLPKEFLKVRKMGVRELWRRCSRLWGS